MNTRKQKNLERLIFKTFEKEIEGTDIYNNNGSMWVIFTDKKKWVVEYTKERTLWYNYSLFNSIMMLFGVDNNETAEYVKMWFENRFLFKPKIKETTSDNNFLISAVEDAIQNGVKRTSRSPCLSDCLVEDTIQNGVKDTKSMCGKRGGRVDYTIQNGVKDINDIIDVPPILVENVIQNGVKDTLDIYSRCEWEVKHAIKNGVRHVEDGDWLDNDERLDEIIQNGVKS